MVTVDDLVALWHGDEETTGYWHAGLAFEVARLAKPKNDAQLIRLFYPDPWEYAEIPEEAKNVIREGWRLFVRHRA